MSSHPRRRKDSSGAGTSQDDSKDLLSGKKQTNSMANHKFFAKPLHTCSYLLILLLFFFTFLGGGGLTRIRSGR